MELRHLSLKVRRAVFLYCFAVLNQTKLHRKRTKNVTRNTKIIKEIMSVQPIAERTFQGTLKSVAK